MKQRWSVLLVISLLLSLLPVQIFGAGPELVVRLKEDSSLDVTGIRVELLKIDSEDHKDLGADRAKLLYQETLNKGLSGTVKTSDHRGEIRFSGLEQGLYLVFERGGQSVTFTPYLAWLESGTLISEPKIEESGNRTFTVTKIWEDGNNADQIRPSSIEVTLLRNGLAYRKVSLSAGNGWTHTFQNLPEHGDYTAMEKRISEYSASYHPVEHGMEITNTHETELPEAVEVTVTVVWIDNNDEANKRPDHVTVQLIKDNIVIKTAVVSEDNQWTTTFTGLEEGEYSVRQFPLSDYTTTYRTENSYRFVITNTLIGQSVPPGPDGPGNPPDKPVGPGTPGGEEPGGEGPGGLPENPDTPEDPVTPEQPDGPMIPQMGAITWPIYVLLICGILLVVTGAMVLRRGKRDV